MSTISKGDYVSVRLPPGSTKRKAGSVVAALIEDVDHTANTARVRVRSSSSSSKKKSSSNNGADDEIITVPFSAVNSLDVHEASSPSANNRRSATATTTSPTSTAAFLGEKPHNGFSFSRSSGAGAAAAAAASPEQQRHDLHCNRHHDEQQQQNNSNNSNETNTLYEHGIISKFLWEFVSPLAVILRGERPLFSLGFILLFLVSQMFLHEPELMGRVACAIIVSPSTTRAYHLAATEAAAAAAKEKEKQQQQNVDDEDDAASPSSTSSLSTVFRNYAVSFAAQLHSALRVLPSRGPLTGLCEEMVGGYHLIDSSNKNSASSSSSSSSINGEKTKSAFEELVQKETQHQQQPTPLSRKKNQKNDNNYYNSRNKKKQDDEEADAKEEEEKKRKAAEQLEREQFKLRTMQLELEARKRMQHVQEMSLEFARVARCLLHCTMLLLLVSISSNCELPSSTDSRHFFGADNLDERILQLQHAVLLEDCNSDEDDEGNEQRENSNNNKDEENSDDSKKPSSNIKKSSSKSTTSRSDNSELRKRKQVYVFCPDLAVTSFLKEFKGALFFHAAIIIIVSALRSCVAFVPTSATVNSAKDVMLVYRNEGFCRPAFSPAEGLLTVVYVALSPVLHLEEWLMQSLCLSAGMALIGKLVSLKWRK